MTLLEVHGLRRVFDGEHVAVDDVSFTVPERGAVALVGESGSGKTTVARIVAGLETATRGEVVLDGTPVTGLPRRRAARRRHARLVQMVFQDPYASLDPRQTLGAALEEVLRTVGAQGRRARAVELLEAVGLDARHADARPRRLSGGQRQRAAIARALALEPRLLILDEAVAALDVSVQAQVLNLLADLRERVDTAFVFVSHDLGVVRHVCDDCLVMHRGSIVESGPTAVVLDRPQDPYTRRLLDAVPRPGWTPVRRRPTTTSPSI